MARRLLSLRAIFFFVEGMRYSSVSLIRYLCGGDLAHGGFEDASVEIYVSFGGGGRHERHIVEGCEQNTAIERVKVHVALEIEIGCGGGLGRKRYSARQPRRVTCHGRLAASIALATPFANR